MGVMRAGATTLAVAAALLALAGAGSATTLPACSATTKAQIDADLAALVPVALAKCGSPALSDLETLSPSDGIANTGQAKFCHRDCITAVAAVANIWSEIKPSCDYGDYDELRSLHQGLQHLQYECAPPSDTCSQIYYQYQFWITSAEGETCAAAIKTSRGQTGADAQASRAAVCGGSCLTRMNGFFDSMLRHSCGRWPAYLAIKQDAELLCATSGPAVNGTATYCEPIYDASASGIAVALDSSGSVQVREAALPGVCSECFHAIQRIKRKNAAALGVKSREWEMCLTDPVVQVIGQPGATRFCLPQFEEAEKISFLNDRAAVLCDTYSATTAPTNLGRCAMMIWSSRLAAWDITVPDESKISSYMRHTCAINTGGSFCHAVTSRVVSTQGGVTPFYMRTDPAAAGFCQTSSTAGQCSNPPLCQNWAVAGDATACPVGCQQAVAAEIASFGCCYNSYRELLLNTSTDSAAVTNEKFDRLEYLAGRCCQEDVGDSNNHCKAGVTNACQPHRASIVLAATVPINFGWAHEKSLIFNASIVRDLAKLLGTLPDGITLDLVEPGSTAQTTQVTFRALSRSVAESTHISNLLSARASSNTLYIDETLAYYHQAGCDEQSTGAVCAAAGRAAAAWLVTASAGLGAMAVALGVL